jgi:hypothetical protein
MRIWLAVGEHGQQLPVHSCSCRKLRVAETLPVKFVPETLPTDPSKILLNWSCVERPLNTCKLVSILKSPSWETWTLPSLRPVSSIVSGSEMFKLWQLGAEGSSVALITASPLAGFTTRMFANSGPEHESTWKKGAVGNLIETLMLPLNSPLVKLSPLCTETLAN